MYKNEEILNPPAYIPTETEIKLAKARYVMRNDLWNMLHYLVQYYEMNNGKEFKETKSDRIKSGASNAVKKWKDAMVKWNDGEMIDAFVDDKWFMDNFVSALSEIHVDDCTAFPATCSRCYSEFLFDLPSSITWKDKFEGSDLLDEYMKDFEDKNKEEGE